METDQMPAELRGLPQVNGSAVDELWANGYYDGALDGFALFEGEPHYFCATETVWQDYETESRRFILYKVSGEQWEYEQKRRNTWDRYVSNFGRVRFSEMITQPASEWWQYYELYPTESDRDFVDEGAEPVAWYAT
ncbi:MAG: hypothetical protein H7Y38_16040 [Armatimonadetes bacterium]|nr:hypothetical protein [Armatimonadota bacterium]